MKYDTESAGRHLAEKHGLRCIRHELDDTQSVRLGRLIFMIFQDELVEEFVTGGKGLVTKTKGILRDTRPLVRSRSSIRRLLSKPFFLCRPAASS